MSKNDDDATIVFADESEPAVEVASPWRILIVDDDANVHAATEFGLDRVQILDRPLEFLHAYSAAQARHVLRHEGDIAVILLDVVMESEDAGLQVARYVREDLALLDVRIILRTGQPGYAPETEVVRHFDINDYKTKSELTQKKLYTALTTALRSYQQLSASVQKQHRLELENISAEARVREGETRFRFLAAAASEAIIVTDANNRIEIWNPGAEKIFGLTAEDVINRRIVFTIPEKYQDERKRSFARIVRNPGKDSDIRLVLSPLPQGNNAIPLEWNVTSWDTGNGVHYSSIFRNISERCRFEDQLIAARDAAMASTRAKAEFLANMSHEIRTPMHGILGMMELVLAGELNIEQREYIEMAQTSAESLLALINDVLDFSKIEAKKLHLEHVPFNLQQSLQDILRPHILRAQQRQIALTLDIDPQLPPILIGDPLRWRQIVLNLVSNALKFTESGSIVVGVHVGERLGHQIQLQCFVRDSGIGIAPDKLALVFETFTQADASISREYGGTGLGLSICQQLVQLMQGQIWVESQPGCGSTFYFTVQLECPAQELPHVTATAPTPIMPVVARPLHILLAEDNPVNQKFALSVLRKAGHTVVLAQNGQEAVDWVQSRPFDIVLMDVQMPVMDGFAATRAIRQSGHHALPIVAMTAHAMGDLPTLTQQAGMTDYVSKPIRAAALLDKLARLTATAVPVAPVVATTAVTTASRHQGVVIDMPEAMLMVGGDQELLIGLARLLLEQMDTDMPELAALAQSDQSGQLRETAHRLKGSLASIAAVSAYDACKTLETLAKQEQVAEFGTAMARLELEVQRLRLELDRMIAQA